jgi:hypothetical protein
VLRCSNSTVNHLAERRSFRNRIERLLAFPNKRARQDANMRKQYVEITQYRSRPRRQIHLGVRRRMHTTPKQMVNVPTILRFLIHETRFHARIHEFERTPISTMPGHTPDPRGIELLDHFICPAGEGLPHGIRIKTRCKVRQLNLRGPEATHPAVFGDNGLKLGRDTTGTPSRIGNLLPKPAFCQRCGRRSCRQQSILGRYRVPTTPLNAAAGDATRTRRRLLMDRAHVELLNEREGNKNRNFRGHRSRER